MKRRVEIWLLAAAAVMLAGCKDYGADVILQETPVKVDLAFAFSSSPSGSQTRQADAVVQNTTHAVVIQHIIPLIGSEPQGEDASKQEDYLKTESHAHYFYYGYCRMSQGVNGCLVYARNNTTSTDYTTYGTLKAPAEPWPTMTLEDISFEPVPIYDSNDVPQPASNLALKLTAIVDADPKWKNSEIAIMKNLFHNFTNHGYNLPGSGASVKQWILALKNAVEVIQRDHANEIGNEGQEIIGHILETINSTTIEGDDAAYPHDIVLSTTDGNRTIHLPDGAAALRWTGTEFVPQLQTTTLDNINSVSRFAYPAPICYFIKSPISTSNTMRKFDDYKNENSWANVLSTYFNNGTEVSSATQTVAVTKPVEYAVAQLKVNIKAATSTLQDDGANPAIAVTGHFPLRGVIVCGQRPVDYEFKQASNSDANVKFIYDPQVKDNCYLTTSLQEVCNTMVLQSHDEEDVNIILEFENQSEETFKCVDGYVYPDTRFYLIGTVDHSSYSATDPHKTNDNKDRVFTKDYITTVDMTVTSLAKAYNVLPNLLTSNLEIGVETTPDWIEATPTVIRLE